MARKTNYDNRKQAIAEGRVFSFEQVEDVLDLIVAEKWPDVSYSDDELLLWEIIRDKLGIKYR